MIISLWPVVLAALSSVVLGFLWYHPKLFGTSWMSQIHLTPEMAERGKRTMMWRVLAAFIASLVVASVMNYFRIASGVYDWIGAVELGFLCWVGFTAPPMLGMLLWEQKSLTYYFIVSLFWLVEFVVMALILLF